MLEAATVTLLCLALATPVMLIRAPAVWIGLCVLCLGLVVPGVHTREIGIGFGIMLVVLATHWSGVPRGVFRAASCAGASPAARIRLGAAMILPGAAPACLLVFFVALCFALARAR